MAGNMTRIDYPGTVLDVVDYTFDTYNRLVGVGEFADGNVADPAFTYTADGFVTGIRYSNNTLTTITPDAVNRVAQIQVTGKKQVEGELLDATLFDISYSYDGANNVSNRTNNLTGYANAYLYDRLHRLTEAQVEGEFIQEHARTPVLAEGDFDGVASMQVRSGDYQVKLDYNANSVGVQFTTSVPVIKVELKRFFDTLSMEPHRLSKDGLSVLKSANNSTFTEVPRDKWDYALDPFGNITITFAEAVTTRYLKIHSRYEDRNDLYEIVDKSTFSNALNQMVKVYQIAGEGTLNYFYDSVGNRTEKQQAVGSCVVRTISHYDAGGAACYGRRRSRVLAVRV